VLHTHSRRLDDHPHVHLIVPGGVIDAQRRQWRKLKGDYLFNGRHLATIVVLEISKASFEPIVKTRPEIARALTETIETRHQHNWD
jgi:hypothetical protein